MDNQAKFGKNLPNFSIFTKFDFIVQIKHDMDCFDE